MALLNHWTTVPPFNKFNLNKLLLKVQKESFGLTIRMNCPFFIDEQQNNRQKKHSQYHYYNHRQEDTCRKEDAFKEARITSTIYTAE